MHLTVHLPALGAFAPSADDSTPAARPATPVLNALLGRASHRTAPYEAPWLHAAFGYGARLPMARLLARRDGVTWGNGGHGEDRDILLAEPVHLVADRDTVRLYPATHLALDPIEVASMTGALDAQFADLGLKFAVSDAGRMYVRLPRAERPDTVPAQHAATQRLLEVQPRSLGALKWHAIQSEIEMLLHDHPVNALREKYGKPRVSGIWFWGEGDLCETAAVPFDVVTADTDWAQQLAREAGIASAASDWSTLGGARVLVHLGALEEARVRGDATRWAAQLAALEAGWIKQIDHGLWNGNIETLTLVSETRDTRHTWQLSRSQHRYHVWKRPRAFDTFFADA
ncbi:MAG: hypothetical protein JNK75_01335 [Betaproteobacteria bacterium]|nr:hypothetical protein [Betaproteobacteria bacterium]